MTDQKSSHLFDSEKVTQKKKKKNSIDSAWFDTKNIRYIRMNAKKGNQINNKFHKIEIEYIFFFCAVASKNSHFFFFTFILYFAVAFFFCIIFFFHVNEYGRFRDLKLVTEPNRIKMCVYHHEIFSTC